jgi:hypothetical protein
MKKTLLLTTALIGTLSILGTAQAEMKIGGGVKTAWKSYDVNTAGSRTLSGFSQERQIDFSTSGTLNNGLAYAAGFSMEQDGSQAGFDGGEGNYVNVTSGNTTIELGNDHILNGDYNIVPRAGNALNEEIDKKLSYGQGIGTIKESMGLGIVQKFDGGLLAVNFVPKVSQSKLSQLTTTAANTFTVTTVDTAIKTGTDDTQVSSDVGKSGYELMFAGGLGVSGLNVALNYASANFDGTNNKQINDLKTMGYGFSYKTGSFAFGAEKVNVEQFAGTEKDMTEIGLTFKMSDNATVGIGQTKTSQETIATGAAVGQDEKINYLQVGYNLGAIGTQLSYIDGENMANSANVDSKTLVLKVNTKF